MAPSVDYSVEAILQVIIILFILLIVGVTIVRLKLNKGFIVLLFIIPLIFFAYGKYEEMKENREYTIEPNNTAIETALQVWCTRGELPGLKVSLIDVERLGKSNTYLSLMKFSNGDIGYAKMIKGNNNKYKITRAQYGGIGTELHGKGDIIPTSNGSFGVVYGINPQGNADRVIGTPYTAKNGKLIFSDGVIKMALPNREVFLVASKLPEGTQKDVGIDVAFYGKQGERIGEKTLQEVESLNE